MHTLRLSQVQEQQCRRPRSQSRNKGEKTEGGRGIEGRWHTTVLAGCVHCWHEGIATMNLAAYQSCSVRQRVDGVEQRDNTQLAQYKH